MTCDSVVDERTLREIYLSGFETAVKKARPRAVMSSYNKVNGVYASENPHLLGDILRGEWGFDGVVVTDWGAQNDRVAAVAAGATLEMPAPGADAPRQLVRAVREGRLAESDIDRCVEEMLELADFTEPARAGEAAGGDGGAAGGAGEAAGGDADAVAGAGGGRTVRGVSSSAASPGFDAQAHHALAHEAAAQSIVLLKNEGGILPLVCADAANAAGGAAPVASKCADGGSSSAFLVGGASSVAADRPGALGKDASRAPKVALLGAFAEFPHFQGAGSSAVNALQVDTIKGAVEASDLDCIGYEPAFPREGGCDAALLARAVELARKADVVLLCLGLTDAQETEGMDRADLRLDAGQVEALECISEANPQVVVLLSCGSVVELPWLERCRALVLLGLGGQAGGSAAVDVVTGRVCPSGRLAETWPLRADDVPGMDDYPATGRRALYREGPFVGYRYYQTAGVPLAFPFGFGLSYASFSYGEAAVHMDGDGLRSGHVSVRVANVGDVAGAEVLQLYVEHPHAQVFGPTRQLAGFARVELAPGQAQTVDIPFDERALRYWNVRTDSWEFEGGIYRLLVGSSCEDIRAQASVEIQGSGAPAPYEGLDLAPYERGEVRQVDDAHFEALLGRPLPEDKVVIDENMCFCELVHSRSPLLCAVGVIVSRAERRSREQGKADINLEFVCNMPLRSVGRLTGGILGDGVVQGLVWEAKGLWVVGLVRALVGAVAGWARNARFKRRLGKSAG